MNHTSLPVCLNTLWKYVDYRNNLKEKESNKVWIESSLSRMSQFMCLLFSFSIILVIWAFFSYFNFQSEVVVVVIKYPSKGGSHLIKLWKLIKSAFSALTEKEATLRAQSGFLINRVKYGLLTRQDLLSGEQPSLSTTNHISGHWQACSFIMPCRKALFKPPYGPLVNPLFEGQKQLWWIPLRSI